MTAPATAENAMRLARRALDRANEAHALAEKNERNIAGLEARNSENMGKIAASMGDMADSIKTVIEMLTALMNKKTSE